MQTGERAVAPEKIRELCDRYENDQSVTAKELAAEVFVSPSTMRKYLRENGVEIRRSFPTNRGGKFTRVFSEDELETMRYLYWVHHYSHKDIAEHFGEGMTESIIRYAFQRHDIPRRDHGEANTNRRRKRERREALARFVSSSKPLLLPSEHRSSETSTY